MRNLDQIRASNALKVCRNSFAGEEDGNILDNFPALVINNGLMAALGFCWMKAGKGKTQGFDLLGNAIAQHLSCDEIGLVEEKNCQLDGLIHYLSSQNSTRLQLCTAESLAYLNYLRRFVKANRNK